MKNSCSNIAENINDNKSALVFINTFFDNIGLGTIFRETGFYKQTGVPVIHVFQTIFNLIFTQKNWWRTCKDGENFNHVTVKNKKGFLNLTAG